MPNTKMSLTTAILVSLLTVWGCQSTANLASEKSDASRSQTQPPQGDGVEIAKGVIGLSIYVGADRVGDTASLYVDHVFRDSTARQAGIKHGDEVVTVNGAPVIGKTYREVVQMVRGQVGTEVKLGVRRGEEVREIAITRMAAENLYTR